MLFQLSILAALVAPFASALTVTQPTQAVTSGGSMTINWTVENGDPGSFSIFLQNPTFNNVYAVANNIDASLGTLTIAVPLVPENAQYTVQIVPIDNVNNVLAESPIFTIGASTESLTTTTSASAISRTTSVTTTGTTSGTPSSRSTSSTTSFGVTVTSPSASITRTTSSTGTNTAANTNNTNTSFDNAATAVHLNMNMGVVASAVLSAVVGVAMFAF